MYLFIFEQKRNLVGWKRYTRTTSYTLETLCIHPSKSAVKNRLSFDANDSYDKRNPLHRNTPHCIKSLLTLYIFIKEFLSHGVLILMNRQIAIPLIFCYNGKGGDGCIKHGQSKAWIWPVLVTWYRGRWYGEGENLSYLRLSGFNQTTSNVSLLFKTR